MPARDQTAYEVGIRQRFDGVPRLLQRSGTIEWDGAVGKTYVVELSSSLAPPISWHAVSTQTLVSPQPLSYAIQTNEAAPAFTAALTNFLND